MGLIEQFQQLLKSVFQWWVIITPWQQGIRVRFGKKTTLLHSGVHLKLPIFDVVYMQPIRIRAQFIQGQTLTTKDGKIFIICCALQYEITDLLKLYKTVHNAHDIIEQKAQSLVSGYIIDRDSKDLSPVDLKEHIENKLNLSEYGLEVYDFSIISFATARTYRLINGDIGYFTGYDQRLETEKPIK